MKRPRRGWIVAAFLAGACVATAVDANLSLATESKPPPSSQTATRTVAPPGPTPGTTGGAGGTPQGSAGETSLVSRVIDGDTVKLSDGRKVRLIGIDTPERGQCGFGPATSNMRTLVEGKTVRLVSGAASDKDKYDRILRFVEAGGVDAGRDQLKRGLARARYDSRDGYGPHDRETDYVAVDADTRGPNCDPSPRRPTSVPSQQPSADPTAAYYSSCAAARKAGAAPLYRGAAGYRIELDRDRNGVACQ